jgi:hypothetical protein
MSNLQRKTIVAIAVTLLSLSVMSLAQAGQDGKETRAAGMSVEKQSVVHREIYNTTRMPSTMTPKADDSAYHGNFTLPEFAPDYHGSNGG